MIKESELYKFSQLCESAKNRAITENIKINVYNNDYADFIVAKAQYHGIEIANFDIENMIILFNEINDYNEVAERILRNTDLQSVCHYFHSVYVVAQNYKNTKNDIQFLHELKSAYLEIIIAEYKYQLTEYAIIEGFEYYDYMFTADGAVY